MWLWKALARIEATQNATKMVIAAPNAEAPPQTEVSRALCEISISFRPPFLPSLLSSRFELNHDLREEGIVDWRREDSLVLLGSVWHR